jgi:hypothetical protein
LSRWKSPLVAAKRTERVAKEVERQRKKRRRDWMLVIGTAVASMGLMVGDYFWLWHEAKARHEQRYHRGGKTNAPAVAAPVVGQNQVTNHE